MIRHTGGLRSGRDLDQVESRLLRLAHGRFRGHHAELLATASDHTHLRLTDPLVDARSVLLDGPSDLGQATFLLSSGACCAVP